MIITGHTARIGKHLYQSFPGAIGMSRSNGWDICNIDKIVAEMEKHNVFINCAHGKKFQQTELMLALFDAFKDQDKLFINIGTDAAYSSKWSVVYEKYPIEKSALHSAVEHLQNLPHACRISLIEPNDIREFDLDNITAGVRFIIDNPGIEIKNLRFQGRFK